MRILRLRDAASRDNNFKLFLPLFDVKALPRFWIFFITPERIIHVQWVLFYKIQYFSELVRKFEKFFINHITWILLIEVFIRKTLNLIFPSDQSHEDIELRNNFEFFLASTMENRQNYVFVIRHRILNWNRCSIYLCQLTTRRQFLWMLFSRACNGRVVIKMQRIRSMFFLIQCTEWKVKNATP